MSESENTGPFQAMDTYVHLGPEGTSIPLPVTDTFWQELSSGALSHLGPGRFVSTYEFRENWRVWERHPAGEEVAVLLAGEIEFVLSLEGAEKAVALSKPGQFLIVPRGAWHTANVGQHATALFITAGDGTEHRPRT